jgi:starch synthase
MFVAQRVPLLLEVQVVNVMKAAILSADSVVTVSESYAWEITRPLHGVGLHSVLQSRRDNVYGIVNGIDEVTWDPSNDPHLPYTFTTEDMSGKMRCKAALRRQVGLPEAEFGVDVPIVAFIGRLDPQKGPDIIMEALSGLLALDCQVRPPKLYVHVVRLIFQMRLCIYGRLDSKGVRRLTYI